MIESEFYMAELIIDPNINLDRMPTVVTAIQSICDVGALDRWPIRSEGSDVPTWWAIVGALENVGATIDFLADQEMILPVETQDLMPTIGLYLPEQLDDRGSISDLPRAI